MIKAGLINELHELIAEAKQEFYELFKETYKEPLDITKITNQMRFVEAVQEMDDRLENLEEERKEIKAREERNNKPSINKQLSEKQKKKQKT